ncbi:hypothetical protein B0O99DRAFT_650775 [Bisporella sp. PMI_857]|nr:hypothetical protein B0O99DRAFT_650775 [Bisporella sp. PMI_857]
MVTPAQKPLSAFTRLSPKVRLYEPPVSDKPVPSSHPTTVILCSWMNALPKHIEYYTGIYMRFFPRTRIILVTISTVEFLFHTEARRRADVKAAVTALLARDQASERLFVHTLSNGGGKRLYGIASVYQATTGRPLPAQAWLIDSAPGIPRFRRDIHALIVPARTWGWFAWLPFMVVVLSTVSLVFIVVNWLPKWFWGELVWRPTEGMNDHRLIDKKCVKGYVYSKDDLAISWEDVERHAREAKQKGYPVEKLLIHDAAHVQLFKGKEGEKGYWGFMERIWALGAGSK